MGRASGPCIMTPMAKKSVPLWRISLNKSTPANFLGFVEAADEQAAIEEAAKEFRIGEALRNRIVARRDG
jgi:hypothetical protein